VLRYVIRRLLLLIPTLFFVALITFSLAHAAPGSPFDKKGNTFLEAVMMGVGGSFDFVAGAAGRAPRWMQRIGLEWLHRLIRQPWRWRRMRALPRFAWRVLRQSQ